MARCGHFWPESGRGSARIGILASKNVGFANSQPTRLSGMCCGVLWGSKDVILGQLLKKKLLPKGSGELRFKRRPTQHGWWESVRHVVVLALRVQLAMRAQSISPCTSAYNTCHCCAICLETLGIHWGSTWDPLRITWE